MHPLGRVFAVVGFGLFSLLGAVAGGVYVLTVLALSANPVRAFDFGLVAAAGIYPVFALFAGAPRSSCGVTTSTSRTRRASGAS